MSSVQYLYAALAATAIIHGTYLGSLYRRYRRLQKQLMEVGKGRK
jgi:hypothetical protein